MLELKELKKTGCSFASVVVLLLSMKAAAHTQQRLNVVTFNAWGLPLTKLRNTRMKTLCSELKSMREIDVVLLQEVWSDRIQERLKPCGFPYAADHDGKNFESGLMILSKHPIQDSRRFEYSRQLPYKPVYNDGERFVHKSLLIAKIEHPLFGAVWLANTHLASNHYKKNRTYQKIRVAQLDEAAQYVRLLDGPVIFGGDLNTSPFGRGYEKSWDLIPILFKQFKTLSNQDSFPTYPGEGRLDHLFSTAQFTAVLETPIFEKIYRIGKRSFQISDHLGIMTSYARNNAD